MEKIKMWAAAKKANLLLKARWQIFLKYLLVLSVLYFIADLIAVPDFEDHVSVEVDPVSIAGLIGSALINLIAVTSLMISLSHFTIASCRNETSYFLPNPVKVYFKYLLGVIGVSIIGVGVWLVGFSPMILIQLYGGGIEEANVAILAPVGILVFASAIFAIVLSVRLSFVLPAIAVGDEWSFSGAWKMTKGHSARLLGSMILFSLILSLLYIPLIVWLVSLGAPEAVNTPGVTVYTSIVSSIGMIWIAVWIGILYEDFRTRHEAMAFTADSAPEFKIGD